MPELDLWGSGRNPLESRKEASNVPATVVKGSVLGGQGLLEAVVERENMFRALAAVERNKGAAGVDKMTVGELRSHLRKEWVRTREAILAGKYRPQPVQQVEIPKPGGGKRMLGIPTVVDRMIQQAIAQVLSPIWEKEFSNHSYGFRPGRSAHMAVKAAREYIAQGRRRWVVDIDLEKFFDRVNHDVLMSRIARKVADKRLLLLIRRYLQSGIMTGGVVEPRNEGTPQGGPLSPLLSNILLDDLDKELEKRGHCFCRYADDCNVYLRSKEAGKRVMASIKKFLEKRLRLKINEAKSQVANPSKRKFLGYSFNTVRGYQIKVAGESIRRFRKKVLQIIRGGQGRNLQRIINEELNPLLRGWANYFRLAETKRSIENLDQWIRRRLRCIIWRQWKNPKTRMRKLEGLGFTRRKAASNAFSGYGPWWNSGQRHMSVAFPKAYFAQLGLISLLATIQARA